MELELSQHLTFEPTTIVSYWTFK